MKNLSSLLFFVASLLLISCGSSPESTGRDMGRKICDCENQTAEAAYKADKKMYEQLLEELEDNKFKDHSAYDPRWRELQNAAAAEAKEGKECEEELDDIRKEALLNFSRDDDRKTMANAGEATYNDCDEKNKDDKKERRETLDKLRNEVNALTSKLPYSQSGNF